VIDGIPVYCAVDKIVDIEKIVPNPRNPNQHGDSQIELLAKIIKAQGWRAPITVSTRSGMIVRGHGRMMAARKLGLSQVPVDYQDYANEAEEWADLIADNRIAELAEINNRMLMDLIEEIDTGIIDLEITGYTESDLEKIIAELTAPWEDNLDEDEAPALPETAVTKPGEIIILGRHRLICGDSTSEADIAKLMNGQQADLVLTDPPYNVDYEGGTKDKLKIQNDKMKDAEFLRFLTDAFTVMYAHSKMGAPIYVFHADSEGYNFRAAFKHAGYRLRQCLIWAKNSLVMGRQDYQWQHEPILYGWKEGAGHTWYGDRKQTTLVRFDKPQKNAEHPTMKPVGLCGYFIHNSSKEGDVILDPFGGSGSTLIACEQMNRACYMSELDPKYCDVIIQRWETLTGLKGVVQGA